MRDEQDEWFGKMKPEHQAGMAAAVLAAALFVVMIVVWVWCVACGLTHWTAAVCR